MSWRILAIQTLLTAVKAVVVASVPYSVYSRAAWELSSLKSQTHPLKL